MIWLAFSWFLLGLAIGLILFGWYYVQLDRKLRRLTRDVKPTALDREFPSMSRLTRAISERVETQTALEQQLATWKQICQLSPIGFLRVDDENQLIWCNPKACQLLGIQPVSTVKPRLLLEVVRSYELDDLIEQTRMACQPCERNWTFNPVSADQSTLSRQQPLPLRGYGVPLENGSVGVFLENRQEAVLLVQQRDRWTSDVAHELRTPLTSIRLVAETLQSRLEPPLKNWIDRLLQETIRLSTLVQDLLDLSQLEARSGSRLSRKLVDLTRLIQSTWVGLEPLARCKQLQLSYSGPDSVRIQADEQRLHRVLLNLLDNSIKYSPAGAVIQVQLSLLDSDAALSEPHVQLDIIDAGPGFAENDLPFVFERFYRADPSRTRYDSPARDRSSPPDATSPHRAAEASTQAWLDATPKSVPTSSGSGLGLAIVRQIVEAHGGSVMAANYPGTHGAWLQVKLPR